MKGIAGKNLKKSMLMYFNKMKEENQTPDFMKIADVTTLYKGREAAWKVIEEFL